MTHNSKQPNQHAGYQHLTDVEKSLLSSLAFDYMMFGLSSHRIQELLVKKLGRPVSRKIILRLCAEATKKIQDSDAWLDEFVKAKLVDHYKNRIDRMEYLEQKLLERFSDELEKPSSKYLTAIAHTIVEVDKTLTDLALAPPMMAKIKQLIPVDINNMQKQQKLESLSSKYLGEQAVDKTFEYKTTGETTINSADDDNAIF